MDNPIQMTAAILALVDHRIPTDIQELLLRGDSRGTVGPGALAKALKAAQTAMCVTADNALFTASAQAMHAEFCRELDAQFTAARAKGLDFAVSGLVMEPVPTLGVVGHAARVMFLQLAPGEMPPIGVAWTVYRSGKP